MFLGILFAVAVRILGPIVRSAGLVIGGNEQELDFGNVDLYLHQKNSGLIVFRPGDVDLLGRQLLVLCRLIHCFGGSYLPPATA